jgi:hypothetical protein
VVEPLLQTLSRAIKAPQIIEFLQHLMRHLRRPLPVIWDDLPGHRSAAVRNFVAAQGSHLTWSGCLAMRRS